jgi:alkylation response protein AidB-like acyl-CoA dehydrogenase
MSLSALAQYVQAELAPLVAAIDEQGHYPEAFLRGLGERDGFVAGADLARQIDITALVGSHCGATAFLVWCQSTCAWYLEHAPNEAVRARYLAPIAQARLLAGTGMSNPVKHLAGIEKIHLTARREGAGYVASGALPWVSNIGPGHLAMVAAEVAGEGYGMFAVDCSGTGVELRPCPAFSGMEGTRTVSLRLHEYCVDADHVLAHPHQFPGFLRRIKPGFMLGQAGIGFGIVQGSVADIRTANVGRSHVNVFLHDQGPALAEELAGLQMQARELALDAQDGTAPVLASLKLRAAVSELALRATQSAALHAGARGYLMRHPAQRRLREALFVAIVTPALKHLRKEIHDLERAQAEAA